MKTITTLSKSLLMALSITSLGVASISTSQAATWTAPVNELSAASQSKIDLTQALTLANKVVKGAIVSAEYDQRDDTVNGHYEIKIIANNMQQEVKVDANTGKVTRGETEALDREDLAEYKAMKQAKITLAQAINNANQTLKGTLLAAEFDMDFGKPIYKVESGKGNQIHEITIDSMTGKVIRSEVDEVDEVD